MTHADVLPDDPDLWRGGCAPEGFRERCGLPSYADPAPFPLCSECADSIGGASAGPDAPWRPATEGEACGADNCTVRLAETAPCEKCGEDLDINAFCGNDRSDGTSGYLCPECYVPMDVILCAPGLLD